MLTRLPIAILAMGLVAIATGLIGCSHQATTATAQTNTTATTSNATLSPADQARYHAFVAAHKRTPQAYLGRSVAEIVNLQKAYETGQRLVTADRAKVSAERALMAHTFTLVPVGISDDQSHVIFTFLAHNLTREHVAHVTIGLSIFDRATNKRIGLTEWTIDRDFGPGAQVRFTRPLPYLHFAEDAGTMRSGAGKPRRVVVEVEAVTFADGGKAGEDD